MKYKVVLSGMLAEYHSFCKEELFFDSLQEAETLFHYLIKTFYDENLEGFLEKHENQIRICSFYKVKYERIFLENCKKCIEIKKLQDFCQICDGVGCNDCI